MLFLMPFQVDASSYRQQHTEYGISVTKIWEDGTDHDPVDMELSYTALFTLSFNYHDGLFPDEILVKYGDNYCGTASPTGDSENLDMFPVTSIREYSVNLNIPLHFSGSSDSDRETIYIDTSKFTFSFTIDAINDASFILSNKQDDIAYRNDDNEYNIEYTIGIDDLIDDPNVEGNGVTETTSTYKTTDKKYLTTYSADITDEVEDNSIIHTKNFTVTTSIAKLELTAKKTLNGETPDQSYTFNLLDADGNILQTKQNDSDGNIQFDTVYYGSDDYRQGIHLSGERGSVLR